MTGSRYLTREGYEKLSRELEYLRTVKRQEVAQRLHDALDGEELIENAEYEAAKNEQAFIEGRIQELEMLLASARIIEDEQRLPGIVQIGAKVTIQEDGFEPETYRIVGPVEADPSEGKISNESPLGKALMEHKAGDVVTVRLQDGTSYQVRILKVE
jgi:transcription elongation factor GreA